MKTARNQWAVRWLKTWLAGGVMAIFAGCGPGPAGGTFGGVYMKPGTAIRLFLNESEGTLLMTEGLEVLSKGSYFIKWKQIYCERDNGSVVIGTIVNNRIETQIGSLVKMEVPANL